MNEKQAMQFARERASHLRHTQTVWFVVTNGRTRYFLSSWREGDEDREDLFALVQL